MAKRTFIPVNAGIFRWSPQLPAQPNGFFSGKHLGEAIQDIAEHYKGDEEALLAKKDYYKTCGYPPPYSLPGFH